MDGHCDGGKHGKRRTGFHHMWDDDVGPQAESRPWEGRRMNDTGWAWSPPDSSAVELVYGRMESESPIVTTASCRPLVAVDGENEGFSLE